MTHRTHHSLGVLGQSTLSLALKAPFEKLHSVARKQRTTPVAGHDGVDDARHDPWPTQHETSGLLAHQHNHHFLPSKQSPASAARVTPQLQAQQRGLFRRGEAVNGSVTDDERRERDFHLPKLFLKGQRMQPMDERRTRASDLSASRKAEDRQSELRHLQSALARETAFRERQAEADRRTHEEEEARDRMRLLEAEIYAERVQ